MSWFLMYLVFCSTGRGHANDLKVSKHKLLFKSLNYSTLHFYKVENVVKGHAEED